VALLHATDATVGVDVESMDARKDAPSGDAPRDATPPDKGTLDQTPPLPDAPLLPDAPIAPDTLPPPDASLPDALPLDTGPTPTGFALIQPGTFNMGSPTTEACRKTNETLHPVTLTRAFLIGVSEVTQQAFQQGLGYNPAKNGACQTCPVEQMDWHEAVAYCNSLSSVGALPACYVCSGSGSAVACSVATAYSSGGKTIYDCPGYRLPTEAEWEFAHRAKTTGATYQGSITSCSSSDPVADKIAWYFDNSGNKTHPVKQKLANSHGIYDMPGNVREWAHDRYQADLGKASATDPHGVATGTSMTIRGGSYWNYALSTRAARRDPTTATKTDSKIGFRCARSKP
jgi:formylglycine-generating enzyme required for sulfatase activity